MGEPTLPPSRRELTLSAAITVGVTVIAGCVVTFLVGFPAIWIDIAMTDPAADASTPTGLPESAALALFVAVLLVLWPVTCRLGRGTFGDAVMELKERTVDGRPAGRRRSWARAGVPLALIAVATVLGHPGVGAALVLLLWVPALLRADRRSLIDLAVGVVPHTTATPKTATPHPWSVREG